MARIPEVAKFRIDKRIFQACLPLSRVSQTGDRDCENTERSAFFTLTQNYVLGPVFPENATKNLVTKHRYAPYMATF